MTYERQKLIRSILTDKNIFPIDVAERTRDLLNECYPAVKIGSIEFLPADIMENCDPVAFRCAESDTFSMLLDEEAIEICGELYERFDVTEAEEELLESQALEESLKDGTYGEAYASEEASA